MVKLFYSAAAMNIETRRGGLLLSLSLFAWQLLAGTLVYGATGIVADKYNSAPQPPPPTMTGVGERTYGGGGSGGQYTSTKDNAVANTLADYLKGYSGGRGGGFGMNDFGERHDQQLESVGYHQIQYGSNQNRYGNSGEGAGGDEQQSHISAGYQPRTYHQSPVSEESESSYEVPHHHHHHQHQSDVDKFGENNFSHQYGQESSESDGGSSGGYYSASGNEGSSSIDYHQAHPELTASQQKHHTDVINYVPYPVVKKVHIPYAKPVQIPVSNAILVPIRRPVPIHIPITKQIQVPVERELKIPVERLVPYPVEKQVPVPVEKHVPYEVIKYVPVKVPKPYAVKVPVVKTVVHKIKQWW